MADPRVSVIVVSYNSMRHIDACLDSLLKQTYADYEVIFVDNCSKIGRAHV
jgi:glycosyltransferase involved in cell wall biosynthesis